MGNEFKQSIQDFYRVAQVRDFARNFQFRVLGIVNQGAAHVVPDDLVYAQTAILPARAITNVTAAYMGLSFNIPGAATYSGSEGYAIQFRADGENHIRQLFETYSRQTFEDRTSTGEYRLFGNSYIQLGLLNQDMEVTRQYVLWGSWPVTVGELSYDIAGTGDIVTFTATMAYQYWTREALGPVPGAGGGDAAEAIIPGAGGQ